MIFRFLIASIRLLLIAVLTLLTVIVALPIFHLSGKAKWVTHATEMSWARAALFILNVRVQHYGDLPQQKVIVMPNHQTFLDIFVIFASYPSSILAMKEIGSWPILKHAIALGRIILVDRKTLKGTKQAMLDIDREVKSGGSVILFPEGQTYEGPLTTSFKSGSFKIAEDTHTPIVPVAIKYLSRDMAWRKESFFVLFMRKCGYWRTDVDMHFCMPVSDLPMLQLKDKTKHAIDERLSTYL